MGESLHALLEGVDLQIRRRPSDMASLHDALTRLVDYLCSDAGRTPVNCQGAGAHFLVMGTRDDGPEWEHLPESYQDLLWDMGMQLDDTFSAPEIAANFDSTPEQLRDRLSVLSHRAGT